MYLSRVELNPRRRAGRRLFESAQSMHAAVLAAFPPTSAHLNADGGRVLWRLDPAAAGLRLYVVSPAQPDFTHLVEQAGWPTLPTWESRPYASLLDRLAVGQQWAFRLTANPTHSPRSQDRNERTKRRGHVTVSQQEQWLLDRAQHAGFGVESTSTEALELVVTARDTLRFRRDGSQVTIRRATYDGLLRVHNSELLRGKLIGGLGPAKAYGCGLLTLARRP